MQYFLGSELFYADSDLGAALNFSPMAPRFG